MTLGSAVSLPYCRVKSGPEAGINAIELGPFARRKEGESEPSQSLPMNGSLVFRRKSLALWDLRRFRGSPVFWSFNGPMPPLFRGALSLLLTSSATPSGGDHIIVLGGWIRLRLASAGT
jgi:hypothetical protein